MLMGTSFPFDLPGWFFSPGGGRHLTVRARQCQYGGCTGVACARRPRIETTAGDRRPSSDRAGRLDRVADRAEDLADLAAQEDQGDDRDDRDEGEDQRVLRESLAFLV